MTGKSGHNTDGTFGPGNPGKPKGTRHKATRAALALLDGESEALTRQAVTMALSGDTTALRLCLERIAPPRKDEAVTFDLPRMQSAQDAAKAAGAVLGAVAAGELTPSEGAHVMALVETYRRTLETTDLEARLLALEGARHDLETTCLPVGACNPKRHQNPPRADHRSLRRVYPEPQLSRLMRHAPAFGPSKAVDREAGEAETTFRARFASECAT